MTTKQRQCKDSVRSFTFREPMQIKTQFFVPNQAGTATEERRLSDWAVNGPLKGNYRFVAEHIRCSIHFTTAQNGQSVFFLTLRLLTPLRLVHLLSRFKYLNLEAEWYSLPFEAYIRVHHELCDSLFQIDRANMLLDSLTQKKLQISLDFDILFYELDNEELSLSNSSCHLPPMSSSQMSFNSDADAGGDWLSQAPLPSGDLLDYSQEDHHPMAKLKIEVEEQTLYAFPEILALQSPVFASMLLNQHFQEATTNVIKLPEKKFEDVHLLLKLLHPSTSEKVTMSNVVTVLKLADEYQIEHLKQTAEVVMSAALALKSGISPYVCYQMATRYNCSQLEKTALDQVAFVSVSEMEADQDFQSLSDGEKCSLLLAKMKIQEGSTVTSDTTPIFM